MGKPFILNNDVKQLIIEQYGIKVFAWEEKKRVFQLLTDDGLKLLKKVNAPYDRYLFTVEAMTHGRNHGFYHIPKVMETKDGKLGIPMDDGVIMMSQWINGREANYDDYFDLEITTSALARFHHAARGFEPSIKIGSRVFWGKWVEHFQKRCKELQLFKKMAQGKEIKDDFDQKILHYTDYFYDWSIRAIGHLENSDYYRLSEESRRNKTFCHHDIAHHNVLITEDQEVHLIDFDYCILDMSIHDLASLLIRNMRYGCWALDKAYFIWNTYNREKPILAEEIGVIKAFMEFPQEFWQIGLQYYVEKQPWAEEVFHRRLDRILDDIPLREVFMKKFLV
ncbi:MAG: CotS family spore coat protein [Anaerosolibacter sp.]|jgi:CotS family spore coat protein|uniref:CotS family spore coat protein n=1 Tax=Anaerosolibacter sp. TaxID=1872527 RepID=UPI002607ED94|nr:CotS family spore coat protein [Anaerosolibacter sp.]MDF2545552.1 CotS family spore coat protein [Anaerosolibacter sp.]